MNFPEAITCLGASFLFLWQQTGYWWAMICKVFSLNGLVYCMDNMLQPLLCMLLILSWLVFWVVHWGCNAKNVFPRRPFFSLFLLKIASAISIFPFWLRPPLFLFFWSLSMNLLYHVVFTKSVWYFIMSLLLLLYYGWWPIWMMCGYEELSIFTGFLWPWFGIFRSVYWTLYFLQYGCFS